MEKKAAKKEKKLQDQVKKGLDEMNDDDLEGVAGGEGVDPTLHTDDWPLKDPGYRRPYPYPYPHP